MANERPSSGATADQVRNCRRQSTGAEDMVKTWMAAKGTVIDHLAMAALARPGRIHRHGAPPKSRAARALQRHLDGLSA